MRKETPTFCASIFARAIVPLALDPARVQFSAPR